VPGALNFEPAALPISGERTLVFAVSGSGRPGRPHMCEKRACSSWRALGGRLITPPLVSHSSGRLIQVSGVGGDGRAWKIVVDEWLKIAGNWQHTQ
jgi:hypothetical protein